MSSKYLVDQKLRPPIEMYSALLLALITLMAGLDPGLLMLDRWMGLSVAAVTSVFAIKHFREAWELITYQYGMRNYKLTTVIPHQYNTDPDQLVLGEGFQWQAVHTQRKKDARAREAQPYLEPSMRLTPLMPVARAFENWAWKLPATQPWLVHKPMTALAGVTSRVAVWNPVAPRLDLGGSTIYHAVEPNTSRVTIKESQRPGHTLVMATTRVMKTRLAELLITQDIVRGHVVIALDPKGDADLMIRMWAEAKRANRPFYLFHLGYPEISARYNGIGNFARMTEVANRTTNPLPSTGNSAAFKEFSWRFCNLVAQAQVALGEVPTYTGLLRDVTLIEPLFLRYAHLAFERAAKRGVMTDWRAQLDAKEAEIVAQSQQRKPSIPVPRSLQDREPRVIATFLLSGKLFASDPLLQGMAAAVSYERSFYEKIIASLGPFLEKLTTGPVGKLLSPDYFDLQDPSPIFDWMTAIRQKAVVYVGLDALSDAVVAGAVGNSMLSDLVSIAGKLYKTGYDPADPKIKLPVLDLHADELEQIMGPEFLPLVNKAGGSGIRVTGYTQTLDDIEAKLGNRAKAEQVIGNFNTIIVGRVVSANTAKYITDKLPKVEVVSLTALSGVSDTAADGEGKLFTSTNQDRVTKTPEPMLEPADLMNLPQGQAFVLTDGNRLFQVRVPLPSKVHDPMLPQSLRDVRQAMKSKYRTGESWGTETDWLQDHVIGMETGGAMPMADPSVYLAVADSELRTSGLESQGDSTSERGQPDWMTDLGGFSQEAAPEVPGSPGA